MSIQLDLETYTIAHQKIKAKRAEIKELTNLKAGAEARIKEYLKARDQPGVIYKGQQVLLNERKQKAHVGKNIERERLLSVLRTHGIADPESVLGELMRSEKVSKEILVVKGGSID